MATNSLLIDSGAATRGTAASVLSETYPEMLAVRDVARLFRRAPRTVRGWLAQGLLPVVRVGRRRFVPREALVALLQEASQ